MTERLEHLRLSESCTRTMSNPAALCCILLCTAHALFVAESAIPNHWSSFYYHRAFAGRQQQQAAQCDASAVSPASLVCKSARLTTPGGNNTHIHVCPVDGELEYYYYYYFG